MDHQHVVDLSHPIHAGLTTYPGLPAPTITGTEFTMGIITMIGNTGTYLDSPYHRYRDGPDLAGAAVLVRTSWSSLFGTEAYGRGAPYLTREAAAYLVAAGAGLVGIDSLNIDDIESGGERPVHSMLLAAGIHVVEHLTNLAALPASGARFTAAPPAIEGFGTFPVRAFATL